MVKRPYKAEHTSIHYSLWLRSDVKARSGNPCAQTHNR